MKTLDTQDPLAIDAVSAIHKGDVAALEKILLEHPDLATIRLGDPCGMTRSLLHVATDWPGHFPNVAAAIALLISFGAEVNARFTGPHTETPLHWAASSDDVEALDALLDAGADIEADGAVIAGGTPLTDAVAFAQWKAARRLVERGARVSFGDAAALGLMEIVKSRFAASQPDQNGLDHAFWLAAHGGQQDAAQYLLDRGANPNWLPDWENLTPLDAAERNHFPEFVKWLRERGGKSANEGVA